jgi:hypothetical protein
MFTKKLTILLSALTLLCYMTTAQDSTTPTKTAPSSNTGTKPAKSMTTSAKSGDFYVSDKAYAEFQKLQASLAQSVSTQGTEKKCHIEYTKCWTDREWWCPSPMYPGSTVHCEERPVRRCDKPETVCN